MTPKAAARRGGFTLIELLVAMAIAVVLLSLAVAVSQSTAIDSFRTSGAADKVSEWLIIAKQRAIRDKLPRGVRFVVGTDPARPNTVSECVYIEAPDPWFPENPGQMLVIQQVVDEADPSSAPGFERKRPLTTRVFLTGVNLADFELDNPAYYANLPTPPPAGTLRVVPNARAKIRVGDTLVVSELPGSGFTIVGITIPVGLAGTPPMFEPNRITATYPIQFHDPSVNPHTMPANNRYSRNLAPDSCPPPRQVPPAIPSPPPIGTNLFTVPAGTPMVELQLASAPTLAPGYSKFFRWENPAPAIRTDSPYNHPTYLPPSTLNGQAVQLPFVGPATGGSNPSVADELTRTEARVPTLVTNGFGIHRQARPLVGEAPLRIGADAVIDLNPTPNVTAPAPYNGQNVYAPYTPFSGTLPGASVDILFTPGGDLLPTANGSVHPLQVLLVRDATRKPTITSDLRDAGAFDASGPLTLVVVSFKGGNITTKPVANPQSAPNNDPFLFAKDGLTGGL